MESQGHTTSVHRFIKAPREKVYKALIDARAIEIWKVPEGMKCQVHEFDAREGGRFRVSLTYDTIKGKGKSSKNTDTYHGHFVKLVPNELVAEKMEFETDDPALRGEMTSTITLSAENQGTRLTAVHSGLPPGLSPADNAEGWRMSLGKLAAYLERGEQTNTQRA